MRISLPLLLASLLLAVTAAADPDVPEPQPSFRAGAEVALGLTIKAPALWVINPGVPFRVTFNADQLKQLGVKADKTVIDFKLKNYVQQIYVELPVKLNKDLQDGALHIPLQIECGICTADQESCTTTSTQTEVTVRVANQPVEGQKLSALKRGVSSSESSLEAPW